MTDEGNSCAHRKERTETIALLNDALRMEGQGGLILVTRGVRSLLGFDVTTLLSMLRDYDEFDEDNNPHGERDFGDLDFGGCELLWKIDYYDNDFLHGSLDPSDRSVTQRVLTVMLATEW